MHARINERRTTHKFCAVVRYIPRAPRIVLLLALWYLVLASKVPYKYSTVVYFTELLELGRLGLYFTPLRLAFTCDIVTATNEHRAPLNAHRRAASLYSESCCPARSGIRRALLARLKNHVPLRREEEAEEDEKDTNYGGLT